MPLSSHVASVHISSTGTFVLIALDLLKMSTVLNFDDSDSSDEEVEQQLEVQKAEAQKIIKKIESAKDVEDEPQGGRESVDTTADKNGFNGHSSSPSGERSVISGKKRRFVDDDVGYSSKGAVDTFPNVGGVGGKRQRRGRQSGFDGRGNNHPGAFVLPLRTAILEAAYCKSHDS